MRILFISQYFYPETFRGNDIAFDLAQRGENVTVLSAIPNYPQGHFYTGYGLFKKNIEIINGVKIIRVPIVPRGDNSSILLILNYFSYAIVASLYSVYFALFRKFDLLFVQQLSPVLVSLPAIIFKKIQKKPLYTWVLDLWPESLTSAGGVKNKYVLNFFNWFTKWEYKNSDKILISSQSFRESIIGKGNFADKLIHFPNWAEDVFLKKEAKNYIDIPDLPIGFIIMYAGNIGESQDFENIMKSAILLKNTNIKFVFIGNGRKKEWVSKFVEEHSLENVCLLNSYSIDTMPYFFKKSDVMLLSLKDELIFNLTVPAKLQAYMVSKKPVIAMINGESADIIKMAKCGYTVDAGNYTELANKILEMSKLDKKELKFLGNNGYQYYLNNFDRQKALDVFYGIISDNKEF